MFRPSRQGSRSRTLCSKLGLPTDFGWLLAPWHLTRFMAVLRVFVHTPPSVWESNMVFRSFGARAMPYFVRCWRALGSSKRGTFFSSCLLLRARSRFYWLPLLA